MTHPHRRLLFQFLGPSSSRRTVLRFLTGSSALAATSAVAIQSSRVALVSAQARQATPEASPQASPSALETGALGPCIDFRNFPLATGTNPRLEEGIAFVIWDVNGPAATTEILFLSDNDPDDIGLYLNQRADILLPMCVTAVEFVLSTYAAGGTVEAVDAAGTVVLSTQFDPGEDIVSLQAPEIAQVRLTGTAETILRGFCYQPC